MVNRNRWSRSSGFSSSVTRGSARRMIFRPSWSHQREAWWGMSADRSRVLRRLRMFDMCRAARRLSMRRRRMLCRLHVLGMCRAACRVSTTRLSSRLFFSTARDTCKRKTAKKNSKCSHVPHCAAFVVEAARTKWPHRFATSGLRPAT